MKVNFGKYLEPASNLNGNYSISNPIARIDTCARMASPTFGTATRTTAAIDPAILSGWNMRPGDWQIGASVQQELMPRVSMEFGYFRRWLTHFTTTDNTLVSGADYTSYTLTAPSDPRLPGGGGYAIAGLQNITQAGFNAGTSNNVTFADNFGGLSQMYNGFLLNFSARAASGLNFQGGINSGKTVQDACDLRAQLPETNFWAPR